MGPLNLTWSLLPAAPHLVTVGCRGELNQAPSLGVAKHLGAFPVEEEARGGRSWSKSWVFCLPGRLSQSHADSP